jgi:transposase InsO family protein
MIDKKIISINKVCPILKMSRSSYYYWKSNPQITINETALKKEIHGITLEFLCYGYRRVRHELNRRGIDVGYKKVRKIMKEENLICRRKKAFRTVTTNSNHNCRIYPNLAKDLKVTGLNQLWVADITYIRLPNGFAYLATIEDVFSRKCIGWALSRDIDSLLTIEALNMAINKRKYLGFGKLIHHSDRGIQYASDAYIEMLNQFGIKISMSRKGNPYDNAFMESFNKTLKVEEVHIKEYLDFEDALRNIKHFIEIVYNKKRIHSSLDYVTPEEFELEVLKQKL